jgi:Fic family protein
MRVHQLMQKNPIISIPRAVEKSGITYAAVKTAMQHLERLGILRESTGKGRNRLLVCDK